MSRPKLAKNPMHFESFEALLGLNNMNDGAYNPSYDDLFSVHDLCMDEIQPFPDHPFRVVDDDKMQELVESIQTYGLMNPGIAIKNPDGGYFIVSGHRRARASMLAGMDSMPFRIIDVDMETARLIMVDSNFQQREELLPSEKAKAYRQKYDVIKRQGKRGKGKSFDEVGEAAGESGRTVQRFIRLSYLSDELLGLVDSGKIGIVQGVDISFINDEYQKYVYDVVIETGVNMSKEQSAKIKEYGLNGKLIPEMVCLILTEKKEKKRTFSIKAEKLNEYFSDDYSDTDIEKIILELLDGWKRAGEKRD